jgi:hypothetical protein
MWTEVIVATMPSDIIATMTLAATVALVISLLMPVMWLEEHLWNLNVLQSVYFFPVSF